MASGGIIVCSFSPNLIFFIFFYAIVGGLGGGILDMLTFEDVWIYFRHSIGKITGVLFFGYGISPALFGALFTFIVNPDNKDASNEKT
jgi:MFS family permease